MASPCRVDGSFDPDGHGVKKPLTGKVTESSPDVFEFTAGIYALRLALVGEPHEISDFEPPH